MTAHPQMQATAPALSERATSAFGAMLVAIGPISMALYTPAMPTLVAAFGTSMGAVKATLTAYFAGFALAQLVCGPLSDGYGRRRVVIGFLALYVAASLLALLAPTVEWLLAARFVQGVGAAAGVAISRAIVRDSFTGQQSARIMNTIGIWLAVGPALSPTIGGILLQLFGWQAIFASMVVYGAALLAVVALLMPETNRAPDPARARPAGLLAAYRTLLADRRFLRPSLVVGLTIGGLYALGTMLPFVLIDRVGLSPTAFGLGMMVQSVSFITGGIVTRRLLTRLDAGRLVMPGLALCALGGVMLFASLTLLEPTFLGIMGPVGVFAFALALFMPAMTTDGLAPFPHMAGAAAALMGFLQMGGGFAGSAVAATFADPVTALATVVPTMTVVGLALAMGLRKG
ncbi:multidrug effflux MFS transporter [Chthonobacter rhizosphaerae]|uniref:multidrug effflux MFS transporter n=1 Tax=Chthonobacter rhizosphaerae TaxID=2735553 RepID=UPI001FE55D5A|nr:multidrug effflux MFS transporter [Chthonobacter rhizosphaerae]